MRRRLLASAILLAGAAVSARAQLEAEPAAAPVVVAPVAPAAAAAALRVPSLAAPLTPALAATPRLAAAAAPGAVLASPAALAATAEPAAATAAPAMAPEAPAALEGEALHPDPATLTPDDASEDAPPAAKGAASGAVAPSARAQLDAAAGAEAAADGRRFDGTALESRAFAATPANFPGGSGALITAPRSVRALLTKDIAARDLPYRTTLRVPQAVRVPGTLAGFRTAPVDRVTDIVFASEEHSGSAGLVRLGYLSDGRPVALKAYHLGPQRNDLDDVALEEAQSAKMLSDLGVGPRFHGIWKDPDGAWNVVFDIARGDFNGMPITAQTFSDLETILSRLSGAGVTEFGDFQPYRTPEGRLIVIDPSSLSSATFDVRRMRRGIGVEPNAARGYASQARLEQLREAPVQVGRRYLEGLRANSPEAFAGLRRLIVSRNDDYVRPLIARYPEFFGPAPK